MLRFDEACWRHDPYPIALVPQPVSAADYAALCAEFPPRSLFRPLAGKESLSEVNHPERYAAFVAGCEPWARFHRYVKGDFIADAFRTLKDAGLPTPDGKAFSARWEFALMTAERGVLPPHTDLASKVVTVVVSMKGYGEPHIGNAGTQVLMPKDPWKPLQSYKSPLSEFTHVDILPHEPNSGVIFVKTHNSWHAVGPVVGEGMRRTVTINIERVG